MQAAAAWAEMALASVPLPAPSRERALRQVRNVVRLVRIEAWESLRASPARPQGRAVNFLPCEVEGWPNHPPTVAGLQGREGDAS